MLIFIPCAGEKNRTPDYCLEGSRFTTKLHPRVNVACIHSAGIILASNALVVNRLAILLAKLCLCEARLDL